MSSENILYELEKIHERLKRIEALLEERLIGIDNPLSDEIEETEKYIKEKILAR